ARHGGWAHPRTRARHGGGGAGAPAQHGGGGAGRRVHPAAEGLPGRRPVRRRGTLKEDPPVPDTGPPMSPPAPTSLAEPAAAAAGPPTGDAATGPRPPRHRVAPAARTYWLLSRATWLLLGWVATLVPAVLWEPGRPWLLGAAA